LGVVVVGLVLVVVGVVVAHHNISAILAVSQVHHFSTEVQERAIETGDHVKGVSAQQVCA
jgi:hypothetical protein